MTRLRILLSTMLVVALGLKILATTMAVVVGAGQDRQRIVSDPVLGIMVLCHSESSDPSEPRTPVADGSACTACVPGFLALLTPPGQICIDRVAVAYRLDSPPREVQNKVGPRRLAHASRAPPSVA